MQWFTGNIGYHHVHHLNDRIPFIGSSKAMAASTIGSLKAAAIFVVFVGTSVALSCGATATATPYSQVQRRNWAPLGATDAPWRRRVVTVTMLQCMPEARLCNLDLCSIPPLSVIPHGPLLAGV